MKSRLGAFGTSVTVATAFLVSSGAAVAEEGPSTAWTRDIAGEVDRVMRNNPELAGSPGKAAEEGGGARMRLILENSDRGAHVSIDTADDTRITGVLRGVINDAVVLAVPAEAELGPNAAKRLVRIRVERIRRLEDHGPRGWLMPDRFGDVEVGTALELLLVGGTRPRGRLLNVGDRGVMIRGLGEIPLADIAAFRESHRASALATGAKVVLAAALVLVAVGVVGYYASGVPGH